MLWPLRKAIPTIVPDPQIERAPKFTAQAVNGCWLIKCIATDATVAFADDQAWAAEIARALNAFHE
jgi:hypothetical protein